MPIARQIRNSETINPKFEVLKGTVSCELASIALKTKVMIDQDA